MHISVEHKYQIQQCKKQMKLSFTNKINQKNMSCTLTKHYCLQKDKFSHKIKTQQKKYKIINLKQFRRDNHEHYAYCVILQNITMLGKHNSPTCTSLFIEHSQSTSRLPLCSLHTKCLLISISHKMPNT